MKISTDVSKPLGLSQMVGSLGACKKEIDCPSHVSNIACLPSDTEMRFPTSLLPLLYLK